MNRKILGILVVLMAAAMLATPYVGIAHAKTSTTVNGTITVPVENLLKAIPLRDGNNIYIFAVEEDWAGDINAKGTTTNSIWLAHDIILTDIPPTVLPDFTLNVFEVLTFHGTVLGQSGTYAVAVYLHFSMTEAYGNWVVLYGTGGLAHLKGSGTIASPAQFSYTYTGQVHF